MPNSAIGPELDGQPEEGQERVGLHAAIRFLSAPASVTPESLPPSPCSALTLATWNLIFALAPQLAHLVDAVLGGAEAVAVMDERQALGDAAPD